MIDGEPWWVATDVCRELGYAKVWNAIERHCKPDGTAKRSIIDNLVRQQEVTIIDERILYRLIGG
jgi:prophage antirepressor-like protein